MGYLEAEMSPDRKAVWKAALFTVCFFPVILIGFMAAILWTAIEVGWYKGRSDLHSMLASGVNALERNKK